MAGHERLRSADIVAVWVGGDWTGWNGRDSENGRGVDRPLDILRHARCKHLACSTAAACMRLEGNRWMTASGWITYHEPIDPQRGTRQEGAHLAPTADISSHDESRVIRRRRDFPTSHRVRSSKVPTLPPLPLLAPPHYATSLESLLRKQPKGHYIFLRKPQELRRI